MSALLLLQLFRFEQFPPLIETIGVGAGTAKALAIGLVLLELAVLPALLGVARTRPARLASLVGLIGALGLIGVLNGAGQASGLSVGFGATLLAPAGMWWVTFLLALILLVLWWFVATDTVSTKPASPQPPALKKVAKRALPGHKKT